MSTIVAGRFERSLDADAALEALRRDGFSQAEIDAFTLMPPGQHALGPMGGGDMHSDAGARHAGIGAAIGGSLGLVVGLVIGSIAALHLGGSALWLIGALGALVGAFAGVMGRLHGASRRDATPRHPVEMPAGRMIAVCVDRVGSEPRAIDVLRQNGARDVGRAQGQWRDGTWRDFDPRSPLTTI